MKKFLLLFVAALALVAGAFLPQSSMAESSKDAEAAAKSFYVWFFKNEGKSDYQLNDNEIYKYVAKGTVDRLRKELGAEEAVRDMEYFTKAQDYDETDWAKHIVTARAIMLSGVAVVPVTFGSEQKHSVLVFLRKIDKAWMIVKVVDTLDYYSPN